MTQELGDGYNIIGCDNGKEALLLVKRKDPQLLITDVMMPEMDGTELCAAIKGDVNLRHIPIIMLTAKTRDEDMVTGLSTGVDAYLTKPFNLDVLRNTIINLLNTRKVLQTKFNTDISEKKIDDVKMLSADEQLMERVVKVINANLTNDSMSVEGLAAEVGLSRVHLYRKMKEQTVPEPAGVHPQHTPEEGCTPVGAEELQHHHRRVCLRIRQRHLFLHNVQEGVWRVSAPVYGRTPKGLISLNDYR